MKPKDFQCRCGCPLYHKMCVECGAQYGMDIDGNSCPVEYQAAPVLHVPSLTAWINEFLLALDAIIFVVSFSIVETNFFSARLNQKR